MQNAFILVCSDGINLQDERVEALRIANYRLRAGYWPLYTNTRNRRAINPGDDFLVYLAGSGRDARSILAQGTIGQVMPRAAFTEEDGMGILSGNPDVVYGVKGIIYFRPIPISEALPRLEAFRRMANKNRWGSLFVGGTRRIGADEMKQLSELGTTRSEARFG